MGDNEFEILQKGYKMMFYLILYLLFWPVDNF